LDSVALASSNNAVRISVRRSRWSAPIRLVLLALIAATPMEAATLDDAPMDSFGLGAPETRSFQAFPVKLAAADAADGCEMHADCSDGNTCNGLELCRGGTCSPGPPPDCSATEVCHSSRCDPRIGCVEQPLSGVGCDDGNVCTSNDVCREGRCVAGRSVQCSDAGPCAPGSCDSRTGSSAKTLPDGAACDDGDVMTADDVCQAGACTGKRVLDAQLEMEEENKLFYRDYDANYQLEDD